MLKSEKQLCIFIDFVKCLMLNVDCVRVEIC